MFQAPAMAVPRGLEPLPPVRQTSIIPIDQGTVKMVRAGGLEPPMFSRMGGSFTGCCRRRWSHTRMAEEAGVEPACAGTADADWFSRPALNRRASLPKL